MCSELLTTPYCVQLCSKKECREVPRELGQLPPGLLRLVLDVSMRALRPSLPSRSSARSTRPSDPTDDRASTGIWVAQASVAYCDNKGWGRLSTIRSTRYYVCPQQLVGPKNVGPAHHFSTLVTPSEGF
jgi:hypothetical protein